MSDAKNWVDFRHVRESINFGDVLEAYGVTLKLRGDQQHHGFCPLPNHEGQKRSPSFSAHLGKKAFQCFGCGAKGNAIDFVALMEGLNPEDPHDIRKAALLIQERFLRGERPPPPQHESHGRSPPMNESKAPRRVDKSNAGARSRKSHSHHHQTRRASPGSNDPSPSEPICDPTAPHPQQTNQPRVINTPLDFELKNLDLDHPYLQERSLTAETIRTFGLGYCNRGIMAGRIAIPLRDAEGRLIGYAGRIVDDNRIDEENPKYRLPGSRERDGTVFEFSKGKFLFNGDRIKTPVSDLIVVEGFFSVFHLHQCGFGSAVALMGSSCSAEQAKLIAQLTEPDGRVWLMPDGDEAGRRCAESVAMQIIPHRFVRWIELEEGTDPNDYTREMLAEWFLAFP